MKTGFHTTNTALLFKKKNRIPFTIFSIFVIKTMLFCFGFMLNVSLITEIALFTNISRHVKDSVSSNFLFKMNYEFLFIVFYGT